MRRLVKAAVVLGVAGSLSANAEEIVVRTVDLPGASATQTIEFHPSEKDYKDARRESLSLLEAKNPEACINPAAGPWMRAETTAQVGISIKGVGVFEGRTLLRQISAAEEALFIHERKTGKKACI